MPNFVKIAKGGIPLLGKCIPKLPISAILGAVSPHFKSDNGWREGMDLGKPPRA